MMPLLKRLSPDKVTASHDSPITDGVMSVAAGIIEDIRRDGERALRHHAARLGDLQSADAPLLIPKPELDRALGETAPADRRVLERAADRIRTFAEAQRASVSPVSVPIPGGVARQEIAPVHAAGCYAPGGRFPLPSSVLMTAITARAAGVGRVIVASPKPAAITLAAAAVAGADAVLRVGGAQAIAAMAFGVPGVLERCDAIVGPGNAYVTAAKQLVAGFVRIDMLAGPSELLVLADDTADPATIAADLLAQAEHDTDARPILITTHADLAQRVENELDRQLESLPTAATARAACTNGFVCVARDLDEAISLTDTLAPEHLEIHTRDAVEVASRLRHYGAVFIGSSSAEVLGDYGVGPNHTLPTGGTARSFGGLSVFDFLRIRTSIEIHRPSEAEDAIRDAAHFARLEGLEAHARSAERRL